MGFIEGYNEFITRQLTGRGGEDRRRLEKGLGHAERLFLEKIWWPAFGHFHDLHAEYEVLDFRDGYRYLDFAFIRSCLKLAIEIDGYGTHLRNISRDEFSDHMRRQNDLVNDGWKVLRFTYDDVKDRPRYVQQTLLQFMGRWGGMEKEAVAADLLEKEVMRFFIYSGRPLSPGEVAEFIQMDKKTARKLLRTLVEKSWLKPASGDQRIRTYELDLEGKHFLL